MDDKIAAYLSKNKVLTLATSHQGQPYCAHCFYAYDQADDTLIFMSDSDTRHIKEALANNNVGGTVSTNVKTVAKLKGIQLTGTFISPDKELEKAFYDVYYKRFPFARAQQSEIWGVKLDYIKMTDNTLGFGTKLTWIR